MLDTPEFTIGVCEKITNSEAPNTERLWGVTISGKVIQPFEESNPTILMPFSLKDGSSLSLQYHIDSSNHGNLLCDWGQGFRKITSDILHSSNLPAFLVMHLPQASDAHEQGHIRVYANPVASSQFSRDTSKTAFSKLQSHERAASGYPHLSPVGATLCHSVASLLIQLQNKDIWSWATGQVYMLQS